jgi:hypothetical protein
LKNVGHRVSRASIARILKAHGIPPVPERPTSWQTFLHAHWGAIAGADFFTTEVWTWRGLVTYYTVFVIDLASRRVQIVGSTPHPDERFMQQVVRTLTAPDDGLLFQHRLLICDRDTKWSAPVRARLRDALSRAECECVRRTVRAIDQRGVPRSAHSDRRATFSAGNHRLRRTLSSRAESPGDRARTDRGPACGEQRRWLYSSACSSGRSA